MFCVGEKHFLFNFPVLMRWLRASSLCEMRRQWRRLSITLLQAGTVQLPAIPRHTALAAVSRTVIHVIGTTLAVTIINHNSYVDNAVEYTYNLLSILVYGCVLVNSQVFEVSLERHVIHTDILCFLLQTRSQGTDKFHSSWLQVFLGLPKTNR